MESLNMMVFPIKLQTDVNLSVTPTLQAVNNLYPIFHAECIR